MGGVIECVGGRGVDGNCAGICGRVRFMAGEINVNFFIPKEKRENSVVSPSMKLKGLKVEILLVGHG